jgi:MinD superfamily P-loop ATPase
VKVAVLSGKGGTGKTTVAVNLFNVLQNGVLIDTDTEEPNSHLFLQENIIQEHIVYKKHPVIDYEKCAFCGACGEHCNFNAIIPTKKQVLIFEDLCHHCGMCQMVCPNDAISYKDKPLGTITHFKHNNKDFYSGKLNIGEVSGVKVIEKLKERTQESDLLIIDCPPGVSCSTVASLQGVDSAIIVIEPTPFGLSDMKMVFELLREQKIPFGVVINKADLGNEDVLHYLRDERIDLITDIPYKREFARLYSEGLIISDHSDFFKDKMQDIVAYIEGGLQ